MTGARSLFWIALALVTGAAQAEDVTLTRDMLTPIGSAFDATGLVLPDVSGAPALAPGQNTPSARLLRHLATKGAINGHRGVVYDNRDRGHSTLPAPHYPSLARLQYGPDLKGSDFGLATRIRLPAIIIGNSSTAVTSGARPRSLARLAMTTPELPRQIYSLYVNNHLYIYPEHRDHDAFDLYPANWPLTVNSQGSSGSDRPFLDALLMSLAAMPPETVDFLTANGLVAPTLQMLLRRNLLGVSDRADYLSPTAHPTVFSADSLRPERMIGQAAALTPEGIAPMVRLSVVDETFSRSAGLLRQSEILFDTPVTLARLWRGFEAQKRIEVSAATTIDPLGRNIAFHWVVLRGDPGKVRITPDDTTTSAVITFDWQDAFDHPNGSSSVATSRVDIGVFAEVAGQIGAPSFVSVSCPTHQKRLYSSPTAMDPTLVSIDYDAVSRRTAFDPVLYWTAPWTDTARYDDTGALAGWTRQQGGKERDIDLGENGPRYELDGAEGSLPTLTEVPR